MIGRYISIFGLSALIAAVPYDGPVPTQASKEFSADGWTPKPTSRPQIELFRRQDDPALCGYMSGDPDLAVTCDAGYSCMYDDMYDWFGCCSGTAITDCAVTTACVASVSASDCLADSSCANDPLAMICTESDEPSCAFLYSTVTGSTYGHFLCAASDLTVEVLATTAGAAASSVPAAVTSEVSEGGSFSSRARPSSAVGGQSSSALHVPFAFSSGSTTATTSPTSSANPQGQATSTTSSGYAARTGAAIMGAAGGVAGLLFFLA